MLISDSKKFIFVHISKTAGTSIRAALNPHCISVPSDKWHSFLRRFDLPKNYQRFKFSKHAFLSDAQRKVPTDIYQSYFKFAVVRNPWDRLVSGYHSEYGLKEGRNPNKKYKDPIGFENYLRRQKRRRNYQYLRISNSAGEIDLDFMLRFENLNADIDSLAEKLNIEIDLPHKNTSFRNKAVYQEYYDQHTRDFVSEHWAQDIELLDYDFDQ